MPVPVRADADILPRFPHDAPIGGNPVESLDGLDDVEVIDDEVFGTLRTMAVNDMEGMDPASLYLTQQEEYGRRLHADERRLAYVALTRARYEALLVYSGCNETSRDSRLAEGKKSAAPSNFWLETRDSMNGIVTAVREPDNLSDDVDGSPHTLGLDLPDGYFVGEHARDFENAVVGDAWNTPLEPVSDDHTLPWPCDLSADVADRLRAAAEQVRAVESDEPNIAESTGTQGDVADESATPSPETGNSLLRLAKLLVADEHLMPGTGRG